LDKIDPGRPSAKPPAASPSSDLLVCTDSCPPQPPSVGSGDSSGVARDTRPQDIPGSLQAKNHKKPFESPPRGKSRTLPSRHAAEPPHTVAGRAVRAPIVGDSETNPASWALSLTVGLTWASFFTRRPGAANSLRSGEPCDNAGPSDRASPQADVPKIPWRVFARSRGQF